MVQAWSLAGSGQLPRPVLFVHGINSDMGSWGVRQAKKVCESPTVTKLTTGEAMFTVACADGSTRPDQLFCSTNNNGDIRTCDYGFNSPESFTVNMYLPQSIKTHHTYGIVYLKPFWNYKGIYGGKMRYWWSYWHSQNNYLNETNGVSYTNATTNTGYFYIDVDPAQVTNAVKTTWTGRKYGTVDLSWKNGIVQQYGPSKTCPPAYIANKYGFSLANLTYKYSEFTKGINHNGLEYYNSVAPNTANDPKKDEVAPFCRLDWTNGVVTTGSRTELGQTNQIYERLTAVLDEYYTNWRTDPSAKIDMVCHSQGCLITRNMIATYRSAGMDNPVNHINSIASVTSPALGTALATDGSGVAVVQELRNVTKSLEPLLQPIPLYFEASVPGTPISIKFKIITLDLFESLRNVLNDFNYGAQYLTYPAKYSFKSWSPPTSVITTTGVAATTLPFMTNLTASGYPTRPADQSSIPLTAFYGTVPTIASKYRSTLYSKATGICHTSIIPFWTSSPVDINSLSWWPSAISGFRFGTCIDLVNYVDGQIGPVFSKLDADWTPYSDFIVDVSSQKYEGAFSTINRPFVTVPLIVNPGELGVPHAKMSWVGLNGADLEGATSHSLEIYNALINPPRSTGFPALNYYLLH